MRSRHPVILGPEAQEPLYRRSEELEVVQGRINVEPSLHRAFIPVGMLLVSAEASDPKAPQMSRALVPAATL